MRDVFLSHVPVTLVVRMSPSVTCTPSSMVVTHKSFSPGSLLGPIWGVSGGEEEGGALVGLPHLSNENCLCKSTTAVLVIGKAAAH